MKTCIKLVVLCLLMSVSVNANEHAMKVNELNAIVACKAFGCAQMIFVKANYSVKIDPNRKQWYCTEFSKLYNLDILDENGKKQKLALIAKTMSQATTPKKAFNGYYFITGDVNKYEFQLYAVPADYGKSGKHTYYIDSTGMVYAKDFGGKVVKKGTKPDKTWIDASSAPVLIKSKPNPVIIKPNKKANEANAICALKAYGCAQSIFQKANYSVKQKPKNKMWYCTDFYLLYGMEVEYEDDDGKTVKNKVQLLAKSFAEATTPKKAYHGYYFLQGKVTKYEHELWAIPVEYGKSGVNTFYIDTTGTVFGKDMGGKKITKDFKMDKSTWFTL